MLNLIFVLIATLLLTLQWIKSIRLRSKLPPGPSGLPILGNVLQLPSSQPWSTFDKWTKQYGPIFYLNIAGQDTIVLGPHKAAADLLDRRANTYSDRPEYVVLNILTGSMHWAWTQADDLWKRQRRGAHESLGPQTAKEYFPYQETESIILVDQLLTDPENFLEHFQRVSTSLNLSIIYGWSPVLDSTHPTILQIDRYNHQILVSAMPGNFWVEFSYFNWMKYLPAWMCWWRRDAEKKHSRDSVMLQGLSADVQKRMEAGDDATCVAGKLLQNAESSTEAAWNSASIYSAGSETTAAAQLSWFTLAMILYPERLAHEELDRVVGPFRLPNFDDHEQLPYIRATVKEILRWRPAAPLALPHRLTQDDHYEGYFLPKGTIVYPNVWSMHHESELYGDDAEHFRPSRFLNVEGKVDSSIEDTKDEGHFSFGFGKRICVGRHVANNNLFIHIAYLLWAFNITAEVDSDGRQKLPDPLNFDDGLTTRPIPFGCKITPRNADVADLIVQAKLERLGVGEGR